MNDTPLCVPSGSSLQVALAASGLPTGRGVAVALNGTVVPRVKWEQCILQEGDRVVVLTIAQGG